MIGCDGFDWSHVKRRHLQEALTGECAAEIPLHRKKSCPKADRIHLTARLTPKLWNKLISKLQVKLPSYYYCDKEIYLFQG